MIQISGKALVSRASNKPKYMPRNIGKKSNQSSPTKRALPNALNFTDWRLSRGPGPLWAQRNSPYIRFLLYYGVTPYVDHGSPNCSRTKHRFIFMSAAIPEGRPRVNANNSPERSDVVMIFTVRYCVQMAQIQCIDESQVVEVVLSCETSCSLARNYSKLRVTEFSPGSSRLYRLVPRQ